MTIKLYDEVLEITNFTTLTQMNEMLAKFKLQPLTVQTKAIYILLQIILKKMKH